MSSHFRSERKQLVTLRLYSLSSVQEYILEAHVSVTSNTSSGQSYKQFTIVNYDSRVIPDLKTPHITTLWS